MKINFSDYKNILYISSIVIALGIVIGTTLNEGFRPLGVVFIAVGGLLFIIGMKRKKELENED